MQKPYRLQLVGSITVTWWWGLGWGFFLVSVDIMVLPNYFNHPSLEKLCFCSKTKGMMERSEAPVELLRAVPVGKLLLHTVTLFCNMISRNSSVYSAPERAADLSKGFYHTGLGSYCCCIVTHLWGFFTWFEYLSDTFSNCPRNFGTVASWITSIICAHPFFRWSLGFGKPVILSAWLNGFKF